MTAPRDHSKAVGGLTFHYVTWGPESAPPLVLLHGLTSHARSWDALGRELSANRRVIALDQRGHGDSDRAPDGDYRVATMAGDVARGDSGRRSPGAARPARGFRARRPRLPRRLARDPRGLL